mgnify:CR=1 FL=1
MTEAPERSESTLFNWRFQILQFLKITRYVSFYVDNVIFVGFPPKQIDKPMEPNERPANSKNSKSNLEINKSSGASLLITIAIDKDSWIRNYIEFFIEDLFEKGHTVHTVYQASDLKNGDLVFFLGFQEIVHPEILKLNKHNLVVHESALPEGKGWSPLSWQILEGRKEIPITLFEAVDKVDAGPIYLQNIMKFSGHELIDELRAIQGKTTIQMCSQFIDQYPTILKTKKEQIGSESFYSRRNPKDSELNTNKTIVEQFDLFRIVDNDRYPAYFDHMGFRYKIKIEKDKKKFNY